MITELSFKNFRAFENLDIELRPLTFLLGPNNSGKSSILSAIRILTQTIESHDMNVPLLLNGVLGDFGTYRDVVYNNHGLRKLGLGLKMKPDSLFEQVGVDLRFKYRKIRREIILSQFELTVDNNSVIKTEYSQETERQLPVTIGQIEIPSTFKSKISRSIQFNNFIPGRVIQYGLTPRNDSMNFIEERISRRDLMLITRASTQVNRQFRSVEYVGAMRVPPTRTFLYSGESRNRVGASGEYAASILALDSSKGGKKSKRIMNKAKTWLKQSGMASDIKIKSISDRHYEILLQHPYTGEYQNFTDVGYGHSQILPVLVAGYNIDQGGLFLVEQPEIHLHPKAQAELGDYFMSLYNNKIQCLVETHSEHLILRLQQHVLTGEIDPADIIFYYVHAKDGKKVVTPLRINEYGIFENDWPNGFFPETLNESKRIAQLRYHKKINNEQ